MKKLNKIIGVILTLAILAGSLVLAVPVTAGTDTWSVKEGGFPLTALTDTYVYTIAGDGTTMYLWTPVSTNLTASSTDNTLAVSNNIGFGPGTISIGGTTATISAVTGTTSITLTSTANVSAGAQVIASSPAVAGTVYKSADAGRTWTTNGLNTPRISDNTYGAIANIKGIKVCPTDPNNLVAWDAYVPAAGLTPAVPASLYRSTDGSQHWIRLAGATDITGTGTTTINSVDIIDNGGSIEILAGTDKGVGWYSASTAVWKNTLTGTLGTLVNTTAYAVAFAPNFSDSQEILGVTVDNSTGTLGTYLRTYIRNDPTWDLQVQKALLKKGNADNITAFTRASLAFPNDFNFTSSSTNKVYVGIDTSTISTAGAVTPGTSGFGDAYRVNGSTVANSATAPKAYDLGVDSDVMSVAYSGKAASGTLIVGLTSPASTFNTVMAAVVKTSTDADTATLAAPNWEESTKNPYGTLGQANVQLASDGSLYVGTRGECTAFFKANEATFNSFNGISMFDLNALYSGVKIGGAVGFENSDGGSISPTGGVVSLQFQTGSTGSPELILASKSKIKAGGGGGSGPSPTYNSGGVILLETESAASKDYLNKYLYKSTDGGNSWSYSAMSVDANQNITAVLLVDDTTVWSAWNGYIGCTSGVRIATPTSLGIVNEITSVDSPTNPMNISLKAANGTLSTSDGGKSWTTVANSTIGTFTGAPYIMPATKIGEVNWFIDAYWNIWSETFAGSGIYEKTQLGVGMPVGMKIGSTGNCEVPSVPVVGSTNPPPPSNLVINSAGGVYFMAHKGDPYGQMWVNTGTTGYDWRPVPGSEYSATGMKGSFSGQGGWKITASASAPAPGGGGGGGGGANPPKPAAGGGGGGGPPVPTITGITPKTGPTAGGTVVTIAGNGLGGAIGTVTFDGVAATGISTTGNPPSYICTTPPHAAGAVDVVLTNGGGTATSDDGFTYDSGAVSAILPGTGQTMSENVWTISPINYISGTAAPAPSPAAVSSTGFLYYGERTLDNLTWATPADGYGTIQGVSYLDTAINAPVEDNPPQNAEVNWPFTDFKFTPQYGNVDAGYQLQIARDEEFQNIEADKAFVGSQVSGADFGIDLDSSNTYYWRVRMNGAQGIGRGLMSMWSSANTFKVKNPSVSNSLDTEKSVYPAQGQTGVVLNPVMTWGIVKNSTYSVQIATDSGFTSVLESAKDLPVAIWQPAKALEPNTRYFWRVQAVSAGISSDWAAFAFTTAGLPGAAAKPPAVTGAVVPASTIAMPTNPVINIPAAEVNLNVPTGTARNAGTPPYVWVVILIGAVLVLAVVVMIIRPNGNNKTR